MTPLKILTDVQKARLLHSLFIHEIPDFLKYLKAECLIIEENKEEITAQWEKKGISAGLWFELAEETERVIDKYGKGLRNSSAVFSEQLFSGYGAIFLNHQLIQYVDNYHHTDPKFKTAIDLFIKP